MKLEKNRSLIAAIRQSILPLSSASCRSSSSCRNCAKEGSAQTLRLAPLTVVGNT